MNVLFMTVLNVNSLDEQNIYTALLKEFSDDNVYIVSPIERRHKGKTGIINCGKFKILRIKTLNITKTNIIEKGIATVTLDGKFKRKIKKYFKGIKFDLVLYSTPPVTFAKTISYFKKRDGAKTYLLLKDIFPQNAVDLGMFKKNSLFYKYFRGKEKKLYNNSDYIGCMSQANCDYLISHNEYIDATRVHISPNCLNPLFKTNKTKEEIRDKYEIPKDKKVFIYGGNLGKPQGISFMNKCLNECSEIEKAFFVICGTGTEYENIKNNIELNNLKNVLLINGLKSDEYNELAYCCDIGMIFLDYRFTIPNFPSRLLSYLDVEIPVIACVDEATDIGDFIVERNIGWQCKSNDAKKFKDLIDKLSTDNSLIIDGKKIMEELFSPKKQAEMIKKITNSR